MLRVSSHRRYVVGTFAGQSSEDVSNTYNVTNFKDYGFLQVFYPTRGILEWYNRATGKRNGVPFNEGRGGVAETHQFPCAIEAAKYALISLDSTMRSNVTVGPPIDLVIYTANELQIKRYRRFGPDDPDLKAISCAVGAIASQGGAGIAGCALR